MPIPALRTTRARTIALRALLIAAAAFLLWLLVALRLFYFIPQPPLHRTDAIIMLGGSSTERLPVAEQLQKSLGIPLLVLSTTDTPGNVAADALCHLEDSERSDLRCFRPSGMETRGEAASIGRLVSENGWKSITVVTSRYHITRASTLIRECTGAEVQMVATHPDFGPLEWLRRFVIETGGLISARISPVCPAPVR